MSTHSYIGIQNEDGTCQGIYSHFDGYLEGVGIDLLHNYKTEAEVRELVEGGDLRSPGEPYMGRAGEDWEDIKPTTYEDELDFRAGGRNSAAHYQYLFVNGEWFLLQGREVHVKVEDALKTA